MHGVMKQVSALTVLFSLALTQGCASILGAKRKDFSMNSNPAGAEVWINGSRVGVTPMNYRVSNTKPLTVTYKMDGHQDVSCVFTPSTGGGWVILDVLTGLVPIVVDAATGNWSQLHESSCNLTLPAAAAAASSN
jgi:hypothetical protein